MNEVRVRHKKILRIAMQLDIFIELHFDHGRRKNLPKREEVLSFFIAHGCDQASFLGRGAHKSAYLIHSNKHYAVLKIGKQKAIDRDYSHTKEARETNIF